MLLPNEWIENSLETYIYQHTTKSQIIYWVVLLAITATMIALPFIYVDISVQGSGVVRPVTEKTEIKSAKANKSARAISFCVFAQTVPTTKSTTRLTV